MTGAEGIGSAASSYFLQSLQSPANVSGSLSGGEGAGSMSGGEGAGAVSASISPIGQLLSNLQQLQAQDPTKFQQVVGQIATELQTAAQQQTGNNNSIQQPGQTGTSNFLTQLAASFQSIANGGSLSQLQAQHHGHHGHHHTYDGTGQSVPSTGSTTSSSNPTSGTSIQQWFANIASQVAQAL